MPRGASNFSIAAKILFDSAQKVGAVGHLTRSGSGYSRQAQKIYANSRSKNSSLSSVSLKVSKFLDSRRTDPVSSSKIVGLEIPSFSKTLAIERKDEMNRSKVKFEFPSLLQKDVESGDLNLSIDLKKPVGPQRSHESSIERKQIDSPEGPVDKLSEVGETIGDTKASTSFSSAVKLPTFFSSEQLPESSPAHGTSGKTHTKTKLILEDQPLFTASSTSAQNAVGVPILVSSPPDISSLIPEINTSASKPTTGSFVHDAKSREEEPKKESSKEKMSLTVDAWEHQRKKELERLEKIRAAEEKRRKLILLEEEHRILGREWVAKRSRVVNILENPLSRRLTELNKLNALDGIEKLKEVVDAGRSEVIIAAAVAIILNKFLKEKLATRVEGRRRLLEILEGKLGDTPFVQKIKLGMSSKKECLNIYRSLSKREQESLDLKLKRKVVRRLVSEGLWEDALSLLADKHSSSKKYSLELCFLQSLLYVDPAVKSKALETASEMFHTSEKDGKEKRLLLTLLEKHSVKKSLLRHAVDAVDADEEAYGALISASSDSETTELLQSMRKKGLNPDDICIKRALLRKMTFKGEPAVVFEEIEKQKKLIGLRPFHLAAAIKTLKKNPSSLGKVLELVQEIDPEQGFWGLKKILPKLYDLERFDDIVAVCDHFHEYAPLDKVLPHGVAFYNVALVKVGREPISELLVEDINYSKEVQKDGEKKSVHPKEAVDITLTTELMLDYARNKNWKKALEAVESLPSHLTQNNTASLLLLFNCALSASVEEINVLQKIYDLMKERGIQPNTTTVNTILSSFARASLANEVREFLQEIPLGIRDNSSYLIYFTLLAKKNMYTEIVNAFDEGRKGGFKYPSSHFAVVLSVTVNHSWETTLRIFQDLVKLHGKGVNETIKAQVLSCLNKNGRVVEVKKLMKQLESKKKKR